MGGCKSEILGEDDDVSPISFQEIEICSAGGTILEIVRQ